MVEGLDKYKNIYILIYLILDDDLSIIIINF